MFDYLFILQTKLRNCAVFNRVCQISHRNCFLNTYLKYLNFPVVSHILFSIKIIS